VYARESMAIPAASLGAKVSLVAIDSRAYTIEPFGLPWQKLDDYRYQPPYHWLPGREPDTAKVVATLGGMLC